MKHSGCQAVYRTGSRRVYRTDSAVRSRLQFKDSRCSGVGMFRWWWDVCRYLDPEVAAVRSSVMLSSFPLHCTAAGFACTACDLTSTPELWVCICLASYTHNLCLCVGYNPPPPCNTTALLFSVIDVVVTLAAALRFQHKSNIEGFEWILHFSNQTFPFSFSTEAS